MISKKSFVNRYLQSSVIVISLMAFLAITVIFFTGRDTIDKQRDDFLQEYIDLKKESIKDEIGIIIRLIDLKISGTKGADAATVDLAKKELLGWIRMIRLRQNQYVVVHTLDGTILAHYKPENVGRNMWDFEDANGVKAIQEATKVSRNEDGGFVSYIGSICPATGLPGRKIAYAKDVPAWGWVVATGIYLDDIEQAAKQKKSELEKIHQENFVHVSIVLLIAMLASFLFAKFISGRMKENFSKLMAFFDGAARQSTRISPEVLHFREFQDLAVPVNQMLKTISRTNEQLLLQLQEEVQLQTAELQREFEKQNQTQRELKESEATIRSIFKAAPVGIGMVVDRIITQANSRLCEITGYDRRELLGKSARVLYPSDDDYTFVGEEKYRQISKMGTGTVETHWQRKTGEIIDVLLSSTPLNLDDLSEGVTFTALDITERKQSEQELRKSEEKFRNIFESLTDVYFETTLDGIINNLSPSAEATSGYAVSELIGKNVDMLYSNPSDMEKFFNELKQNGRIRGFELPLKKKNGDVYDVSITADFRRNESGEPDGLFGTIRDVTQQKMLEDKLLRSKKMESLGLMASGIAHDLNNILSGIASYPELLLLDLPKDSPLRKAVKIIRNSGRRASEVVADLLTIAKGVEAGKDVMNLNLIVAEYFDSAEYKRLSQDHPGVEFMRELDADLLNTRCSSTHMKKILMNLVSNAAEAIEARGRVEIKTTNRYLDKPLRGYDDIRIGEYVLLQISDSGSGISRDNLERIFDPFYTRKVLGRSGTGLGLTVVWNTVQDHNGYINVNSDRSGSVFELYFPVTRDAALPDREPISIAQYLGNGEHILVVDDEENQRTIARDLLEKLNYSVTTVSSGEAAVAHLKSNPVDLMVLDMIMLSGMNGRETFEKAIVIQPGLKAVIASGFAETEEVRAAQEMGAGDYIKKPYTLEKIGVAIRDELQK